MALTFPCLASFVPDDALLGERAEPGREPIVGENSPSHEQAKGESGIHPTYWRLRSGKWRKRDFARNNLSLVLSPSDSIENPDGAIAPSSRGCSGRWHGCPKWKSWLK